MERWLAEEARKRQVKAGKLYGEGHPKREVDQKIDQPLNTNGRNPQSAEQAAKIVGTNRQYVSDAKQ